MKEYSLFNAVLLSPKRQLQRSNQKIQKSHFKPLTLNAEHSVGLMMIEAMLSGGPFPISKS